MPDDLDVPIEPLPFTYMSTRHARRGSRTASTRTRGRATSSRSTGRRPSPAGSTTTTRAAGPTLRHRLQQLAAARHRRPLAGAGTSNPEPRGIARRGSAARADPDGDRLGQDLHRRGRRLPPRPLRRREANPLPRRPRQPRPPDAERVPDVHGPERRVASSPSSTTSSTCPRTRSTRSRG